MNCLKKKVKNNKAKVAGLTIGLVTVGYFIGNTPTEIEANIEALEMVDRVIHSHCFSGAWLNSKVDESQLNGLTKEKALFLIQTIPVKLNLEAYRANNNTIGYTYKSRDTIWFNRRFHDDFNVCEKSANLAHEIHGHKNGFTHETKATARRKRSAPYVIGDIVKYCCEKDLK